MWTELKYSKHVASKSCFVCLIFKYLLTTYPNSPNFSNWVIWTNNFTLNNIAQVPSMHCNLKTFCHCQLENLIYDLTFVDPHHVWESCADLIPNSTFNTFVYLHKSLPLVLRVNYYPCYTVGLKTNINLKERGLLKIWSLLNAGKY